MPSAGKDDERDQHDEQHRKACSDGIIKMDVHHPEAADIVRLYRVIIGCI